jgi:hypothetical protein
MVVSIIALIVALTGTAVAAGPTAYEAITGKTIIKKIGKGKLPGNKIKKNSITGTQINEATLAITPLATKAKTADSATTAGSAGSALTAGNATTAGRATVADSADKIGKVTYKVSDAFESDDGAQAYGEAVCNAGDKVVSGGVYSSSSDLGMTVNSSYPSSGDGSGDFGTTAWSAYVDNQTGHVDPDIFGVFAICSPVASSSDNYPTLAIRRKK